ncbi:MAG: tRNA (adenosine(37)-N6)-dimethylallyltransferase MiaA [Candidatus Roizmanbacteria bacterium]
MKTIYFILGQTATGKTARAALLAREIDGELINCDSRQVYRHLDIITGKSDNPPDIPMHMVDIVDPSLRYSAHEYAVSAKLIIDDIVVRGKSPIIVGGTGLYAYYLLHLNPDRATPEIPLDAGETNRIDSLPISELQHEIMEYDQHAVDTLNESDRSNPHRLGSLLKKLRNPHYKAPLSPTVTLESHTSLAITVLLYEKSEEMRSRITRRVEDRMKSGAIEECKQLLSAGYTPDMPGLKTLGYAQIYAYLNEQISLDEAQQTWVSKEIQYAKRQKTYMQKYFVDARFEMV